ncbi:CGNR zinc finger domain-containing protein [Nonomuraea sp. M3C6]|uniref:CGNR zinc finger domain-containing protein n=1 Tax=Nonomuraea marmarensis TaxID=3351344 RepID=A0ABW7APL3_9ACTN
MAGSETSGGSAARIPAAAAAIVDLLNSRPHATPLLPDTLDDPETAGAILHPFGQPEGVPPAPRRLDEIRALRSDLMAIIAEPNTERGWADLTEHISEVTVRHAFSAPGQVRLRPASGDPVAGGITLAVAELIAAGSWSRIRACANDLCRHVFYDTTRSRTQRWDSYETCGNRSNVAAYRARKNAAHSAD